MNDQNMKRLEQKIAAYYATKSMPDERLDRILQHHDNPDSGMQNISISRHKLYSLTGAVALLFFAVLIGQFFILKGDVAQQVFAEIAMNHNKHLQPEFPISSYQELAVRMQRLDFTLAPPDIIQSNYDVLGGRYCSIRGNIAAQIKLKDKQTEKIATLYVTRLNSYLTKMSPKTTTVDQAIVRVWRSENIFYGLATDVID